MRETDVEVIRSRCAFAMASPNSQESVAGPRGSFCALGQGDGVSGQSGRHTREGASDFWLSCLVSPIGIFCLCPPPVPLAVL